MYVTDPFLEAEQYRDNLMLQSEREIRKFYEHSYRIISNRIARLSDRTDESSVARRTYLEELRREIQIQLNEIDSNLNTLVTNNVNSMITETMSVNSAYLNHLGFNYYTTSPALIADMSNRVLTGQLYSGNWTLSTAIWGNNVGIQADINRIISRGILQGKTTYQIAKELEKYVNPDYTRMVASGTRGRVDYNAQRLVRTTIQHAYQEAFVQATRNNPFIIGYKWETSGMSNVCHLCMDRESLDEYGLGEGVFPKDALPLDHPNGNCTFSIVSVYSEDEIQDMVDDWRNDYGDAEMNGEIDYFIDDLF